MPYRSSFFTSMLNGGVQDRVYTADDLARRFAKHITNGVETDQGADLTSELQVSAVPASMGVSIAVGSANINGYAFEVYDSAITLTHTASHATLPRIDRIVLELNLGDAVRAIVPKIVAGTPASSPAAPALTRTATVYQLSLARVLIPAASGTVSSGNITDERSDASVCGLAKHRYSIAYRAVKAYYA